MAITIEVVGARLYVANSPFAAKDQLKSLGCHWDGERRQWWIGATKNAELTALVQRLNAAPTATTKEDPSNIRLTGKGRYKGRIYYAGAITKDGQKVRLLTLPDAQGNFLDFWALCSEVEEVKQYPPREYRGQLQYTTLGSISRFVAKQKRYQEAGTIPPVKGCSACSALGHMCERCRFDEFDD